MSASSFLTLSYGSFSLGLDDGKQLRILDGQNSLWVDRTYGHGCPIAHGGCRQLVYYLALAHRAAFFVLVSTNQVVVHLEHHQVSFSFLSVINYYYNSEGIYYIHAVRDISQSRR